MSDSHYIHENIIEERDTALGVAGQLPAELRGTFYAVGGTGTSVGATRLHSFDAHGRVTAFHIDGDKSRFRARMVETPVLKTERATGKVSKRRLFMNKPNRWSNFLDVDLGNNAWHNVVRWGEHLVALNDPGFFLLDPVSLETKGPAPLAPKKGATFSPMVHKDARSNRWIVVENRPGLRDTLIVREVGDDFVVHTEHAYTLPRGGVLIHDVGFTDRYYIVCQFGALSVPAALWGAKRIADTIRFDPNSTPMLYLLPRKGGPAIPVPLPNGSVHFHFWNTFDDDGGDVVVDASGYAGRVSFSSLYPPETRAALGVELQPSPPLSITRARINVAKAQASVEEVRAPPMEAPAVREDRRGRPLRYGYAPTRGEPGDEEDTQGYAWFHALARLDFETRETALWDAGQRCYVSPAAFVPRAGSTAEDDGWVLAMQQDAAERRSSLLVFDAARIVEGPVATLQVPSEVGMIGSVSHVSFHGVPPV